MAADAIDQKTISDETVLLNPGKLLDNNNAHVMVDSITAAQADGFKNIIIDMSDLQLLSSAGVGSILGTIEIARDAGGDIYLCNIPDNIRHVLQVLDLEDYLTIESDEKQAYAKCGIEC